MFNSAVHEQVLQRSRGGDGGLKGSPRSSSDELVVDNHLPQAADATAGSADSDMRLKRRRSVRAIGEYGEDESQAMSNW
eukprot:CAMPEP_0119405664 /NCGR_PEP_ID=MMETSP1335-20130426/262_1 /TAXON_ID=259385 /ORGANISM="Chrysoculter rhomboideus, Strain RCC1486" /LENGTH=78 /DNA_ID=CAMNT_0007429687 /DNA_START=237 /DNA_END=471 /DNA_ORIENTATION=+